MKNRRLLGRQLLLPSTALQWTALKQTIKLFRQMLKTFHFLFARLDPAEVTNLITCYCEKFWLQPGQQCYIQGNAV